MPLPDEDDFKIASAQPMCKLVGIPGGIDIDNVQPVQRPDKTISSSNRDISMEVLRYSALNFHET